MGIHSFGNREEKGGAFTTDLPFADSQLAGVPNTEYTCPYESHLLMGPSPETWRFQTKIQLPL